MKAQGADMGLEVLGVTFTETIRLYPILYRGNVISVVLGMADEKKELLGKEREATVELACSRAGMALEMISLRKQILSAPAGV